MVAQEHGNMGNLAQELTPKLVFLIKTDGETHLQGSYIPGG